MLTDRGLAPGTVNSVHTVLVQVFEAAVMDSLIRANPTRNVLKSISRAFKKDPKEVRALTLEEQERFVNYVHSTPRFRKWAPLFTVLLGTGMRIGEALGLTWSDCDFKNNVISVNHTLSHCQNENGVHVKMITPPKTKSSNRIIPMLSDVRSTLMSLQTAYAARGGGGPRIGNYSGFVFVGGRGELIHNGTAFGALRTIIETYNQEEAERAERDGDEPFFLPHFGPHVFRHTFCTRFCENETDIKVIQEIMGHKDVRMTMNIYNTATAERKMNTIASLEGKIKIV